MSSSFYLTLPSNSSMKYFPNNTASHYFTKLPQTIDLSGEYEVGLSEVHISHEPYNILSSECKFAYKEGKHAVQRYRLPTAKYTQHVDVINNLTNAFYQLGRSHTDRQPRAVLNYDHKTQKVSLVMVKEGGELVLSRDLARVLGFKRQKFIGTKPRKTFRATRPMSLLPQHKSVYVYCDIVTPRPVGDYMVPLLRTLPTQKLEKKDVHIIYEKPHYIPISRPQFNNLEILITSDKGEELPFEDGHVVVTLHIRRRRPDY